jgi:hypothetical protein
MEILLPTSVVIHSPMEVQLGQLVLSIETSPRESWLHPCPAQQSRNITNDHMRLKTELLTLGCVLYIFCDLGPRQYYCTYVPVRLWCDTNGVPVIVHLQGLGSQVVVCQHQGGELPFLQSYGQVFIVPTVYATTCCAGVTRRFHKTTFRGFFSERELVDFLHMLWRHFCQILLRTWKRIQLHTYQNKLRFLIERHTKLQSKITNIFSI